MGGVKFGLYKARSHIVEPIPECLVHHPRINAAVEILEKATVKCKTTAYVDPVFSQRKGKKNKGGPSTGNLKGGEGMLRYVQLTVERTTNKVTCSLVWNSDSYKNTQPNLSYLVKEMRRLDDDLWHSIWVNCNDGGGNVIFKEGKWDRVYGQEFSREEMGGGGDGKLFFTPKVFRQGNMDGFEVIAERVGEIVGERGGRRVCELYAGVGVIGLGMWNKRLTPGGGRLKWLRCSDANPNNYECFERAKKSMGLNDEEYGSVGYLTAMAGDAMMEGEAVGADVLIVDPPRAGLEDVIVDELCKPRSKSTLMGEVKTVCYVSCGFQALTRDLERLFLGRGGWKIQEATGYMLFPGTNHVETLVVLTRD